LRSSILFFLLGKLMSMEAILVLLIPQHCRLIWPVQSGDVSISGNPWWRRCLVSLWGADSSVTAIK
jgi:hypothetical protein